MKYAYLFLAFQTIANGALIWSDNFESYDTDVDNLDDQVAPSITSWFATPDGTVAIAAISTGGLGFPASFGAKSLAIGGVDPTAPPEDPVTGAVAVSPTAANFTPAGDVTEAVFSTDMIFSVADVDSSITDRFRIDFFDSGEATFASILFQAKNGSLDVSILRTNTVDLPFDTQFAFGVNTAVTLNLVMNFELNKWSGSLGAVGGSSVPLFANVDMTGATTWGEDLGGFAVNWLQGTPGEWGSNTLIMDNMSLTSQVPIPEPSSSLLLCGFSLLALFRRGR